MRVFIDELSSPRPAVEDELPFREALLTGFLWDANNNEDIYLDHIARAEGGEPDILGDHHVWANLFPDRVVIEAMHDPERGAEGPSPYTVITLAEAKQLILDWLAAKERFYGGKRAN